MNTVYVLWGILIMSTITFAVRALPFYFIEFFQHHDSIRFIVNLLPAAIMLILVIFSLQNISLWHYPYGAPEIIAVIAVVIIHIAKRNLLLSVAGGVVIYGLLKFLA